MSADLRIKAKLILLIFLGLVVAGCEQNNSGSFFQSQSPATEPPILKVNSIRVTRDQGTVETAIFFGKLKPNRQSQLRFGQGGRIKTMLKEVGQELKSGEQIAALDLEQLEKQKSELESSIAAGQDFDQQLQAQLQSVELELAKGSIVAPYDCVIASQNAVVGDLVSPQAPVVTVIEKLPVVVEANLPLNIALGQRSSPEKPVWVDVGTGEVRAQFKSVSPLESTAGSRIVSFQITEGIEQADLSFGQTVKIRFLLPTDNSGHWIPTSALSRESTGLWSALVLVEESETKNESDPASKRFNVERKMLQVVQLEDSWALAQGAFLEEELVIVNGSHRVVPGQLVEALDVSAQYAKPSEGDGE